MITPDKRVTIKDIAARLGVSCKAVSMGINGTGRLSDATRKRILATARELHYMPNVAARSLVMRRSYLIGAVVPSINTSFFGNIIAGIEDAAYERDFALLLSNFSSGCENERRALERVLSRKVDGLIVCPSEALSADYQALAATMPVVQIMDTLPGLGDHYVVVDNYGGARSAVRHLIELGHRQIGLICHDEGSASMRLRHRGFNDEMQFHGLELRAEHIGVCEMSIAESEKTAGELLERAPELTAIFAASDYSALGVIRAALKLCYRVPQELSVVGFDDLEIAAQQLVHPLSTIAQPKELIGRLAGSMLIDLLEGKPTQSQLLDAPLIQRATSTAL